MIEKGLTFGEKVIALNNDLKCNIKLPKGFKILNPFKNNPETESIQKQFYKRYYNDYNPRKFLIGINPGRLGAGTTGIPFTDTKRLEEFCGIKMESAKTHEVSAMFIYDLITSYGGVNDFYNDVYINSVFPLAIVRKSKTGKWLNANYYDDMELYNSLKDYMIELLKEQIQLGLNTEQVYVLGIKNAKFIKKLNKEAGLFKELIPLEHPRYVQQYKTKDKKLYIDKYIKALTQN